MTVQNKPIDFSTRLPATPSQAARIFPHSNTGVKYILIQGVSPTNVSGAPEDIKEAALTINNPALTATQSSSSGDAMADPTREETDAKIAASEARTDTKVARLESKIDLVLSKLDDVKSSYQSLRNDVREDTKAAREDYKAVRADVREDARATRANILAVGLGLAVLIVALVALYPTFFGLGAQVRDMVDSAFHSHLPTK